MQPWRRYWAHLPVAALSALGAAAGLDNSSSLWSTTFWLICLTASLYNAVLFGVGWQRAQPTGRALTPDEVLDALQRGAFLDIAHAASKDFAPKLRKELPDVWRNLVQRCGSVSAVGSQLVSSDEEGRVLHELALAGPLGEAHLQLAYADDAIVGMVLRPGAPTGVFGT